MTYGGANKAAGIVSGVLAHAPVDMLGRGRSMTIFGDYFTRERDSYTIVHEMGHTALGYSDRVTGVKADGKDIFDRGSYFLAYRAKGIAVAIEQGVVINDMFACMGGYTGC